MYQSLFVHYRYDRKTQENTQSGSRKHRSQDRARVLTLFNIWAKNLSSIDQWNLREVVKCLLCIHHIEDLTKKCVSQVRLIPIRVSPKLESDVTVKWVQSNKLSTIAWQSLSLLVTVNLAKWRIFNEKLCYYRKKLTDCNRDQSCRYGRANQARVDKLNHEQLVLTVGPRMTLPET